MSLSESHCEKGNIPHIFCSYSHFREQYSVEITSGLSWHNYISSKRKTPKFSNQPSVCTFSLNVGLSGISFVRI